MRLPTALARDRFRQARVARLATVSGSGNPHLVPVTFAVISATPARAAAAEVTAAPPASGGAPVKPIDAELIVFAVDHKPKSTTALRRLDNIAANPRVAFLVDGYDENWDRLWWARADALAEIIEAEVRLGAIAALRAKYQQYESRPPDGVVVGCTVLRWSGWRAAS